MSVSEKLSRKKYRSEEGKKETSRKVKTRKNSRRIK